MPFTRSSRVFPGSRLGRLFPGSNVVITERPITFLPRESVVLRPQILWKTNGSPFFSPM